MFYNTTFAPAFERERRYKMMKQTFRKNNFRPRKAVPNGRKEKGINFE